MRCMLIGNYGTANFGDEALRVYFLARFPEIGWIVVSSSPSEGEAAGEGRCVPRLPFGLRSLLTPWWRTLAALRRCETVVFGGGTLFTDVEEAKACWLWWWHAFVAHLCGKSILLAFQGIGPFRTRGGEWCARWVVSRAAHISVRDEASLGCVKQWRNDVVLTFDPVFSLMRHGTRDKGQHGKILILIPRANSTKEFFARAEELWKSGRFDAVKILSFKPGEKFPLPAGEAAGERFQNIIPITSIPSLVQALRALHSLGDGGAHASFILTQRYHGAVAALALGIPFEAVGQGRGDKHETIPRNATGLQERVLKGEQALRDALSLPAHP